MTHPDPRVDHVTLMRQHVRQLRAQADRYEQAIALIEGEARPARAPKVKEGRQETRPTQAGQKAGTTRTQVVNYLAAHPGATVGEIAKALRKAVPAIAYHLKALRS